MSKTGKNNSGIWCVGLCLDGGRHKFCIFDDYEEAKTFQQQAMFGDLVDLNVVDASLWEM